MDDIKNIRKRKFEWNETYQWKFNRMPKTVIKIKWKNWEIIKSWRRTKEWVNEWDK